MIEKLGITTEPWEIEQTERVETGLDILINDHSKMRPVAWCYLIEDACLIRTAPEMLEALIDTVLIIEGSPSFIIGSIEYELRNAYIPIIERATGKTWSEIKDLI